MYKRSMFVFLLVVLLTLVGTIAGASNDRNFRAHLSGDQEVPARETQAQGQAIFNVSKDGSSLHYKVIVANIQNITQAHIHCGAPGVNGPTIAFLYPLTAGGVTVNGPLSEGTIAAGNVMPRPDSQACPGGVDNFDDLLNKIRTGQAYVNVHTTGIPSGEIRGHIK